MKKKSGSVFTHNPVQQNPLIAPQAGRIDDRSAITIQPIDASISRQTIATRILHVWHNACRTTAVLPHNRTEDRPARGYGATPPASQRG